MTGVIQIAGDASVQPGDRAEIAFELMKPVGIEAGVRFAIREGGRTVGAGLVTEVG
ncbi:translation elongation factor EF-Tu-like GTPase [Phenylobacterium haematophilum]|uniref:Translation elongation factor EF-Tu-like GTPase n=1 Tax=Phenylobacterium haematophilum TaxID=98513 RepID=A0A840A2A0_9CAUL|nr:translation elongation factor EF-Tu-like GTPase [Phenylobacterium haematophilum]